MLLLVSGYRRDVREAGARNPCNFACMRLCMALNCGSTGLAEKGDGHSSTAEAFDRLPSEQRAAVRSTLSAVLQGKPELAGHHNAPTPPIAGEEVALAQLPEQASTSDGGEAAAGDDR